MSAYDFVFDRCANGQQLKCLTVVDEFTHECLAIDVAGSIRFGRVIELLGKLVSVHVSRKHLRSGNGSEFVSRAVLKWLTTLNIDTAHIDPGNPWYLCSITHSSRFYQNQYHGRTSHKWYPDLSWKYEYPCITKHK